MAKKIPAELSKIIDPQPGNVVELEFEGDASGTVWVMLTRDRLKQLMYDDDDLSTDEMLAAATQGLDDPEGWGAAGMEVYDDTQPDPPSS